MRKEFSEAHLLGQLDIRADEDPIMLLPSLMKEKVAFQRKWAGWWRSMTNMGLPVDRVPLVYLELAANEQTRQLVKGTLDARLIYHSPELRGSTPAHLRTRAATGEHDGTEVEGVGGQGCGRGDPDQGSGVRNLRLVDGERGDAAGDGTDADCDHGIGWSASGDLRRDGGPRREVPEELDPPAMI